MPLYKEACCGSDAHIDAYSCTHPCSLKNNLTVLVHLTLNCDFYIVTSTEKLQCRDINTIAKQ